jgi:hypothetical protein
MVGYDSLRGTVKMKVEVYCPECGYLCNSEDSEITKINPGLYKVNMVCWKCESKLPIIHIHLEKEEI